MLLSALGASVKIVLNPSTDITEFPLKCFYRYVCDAGAIPGQREEAAAGSAGSVESVEGGEGKEGEGGDGGEGVASGESSASSASSSSSSGVVEALFRHLPTQHIYTMKITTPEAWNVQMHQTWADLDNIRLTDEGKMGYIIYYIL